MSRPLVTFVTAAYKSDPDHLAEAIESALGQSWANVEIIVSDDSPDPALGEVVGRYADPRIVYQHNSPRLGVALNPWSAFRRARGEFIAVLNHDDRFEDTFLECLTPPLIDDPTLALAFCDHWVIDTDGQRRVAATEQHSADWGRANLPPGVIKPFFDLFATQTIPLAMGTVFRRSLLPDELPAEVGPAYDLWLTYLLCREGRGAFYLPDRLANWRVHASNLTGQGDAAWFRGTAACWEAAKRDPGLVSIRPAARGHAVSAYLFCAVGAWRAGRRRDCLRNAWYSLRAGFTWKGLAMCLLALLPKVVGDRLLAGGRRVARL